MAGIQKSLNNVSSYYEKTQYYKPILSKNYFKI